MTSIRLPGPSVSSPPRAPNGCAGSPSIAMTKGRSSAIRSRRILVASRVDESKPQTLVGWDENSVVIDAADFQPRIRVQVGFGIDQRRLLVDVGRLRLFDNQSAVKACTRRKRRVIPKGPRIRSDEAIVEACARRDG